MSVGIKICNKCHQTKDLTDFRKSSAGYKDGYKLQCVSCLRELGNEYHHRTKHKKEYSYEKNKDTHLKRLYGISYKEYQAMLEAQGGRCAICATDNPGKRAFAVDHCHDTGAVRGLLCSNCNTGIGSLQDSIEMLERAIKYLK